MPGQLNPTLIREHFAETLQTQNPTGWKQAHKRLYHYYRNLPEKELPDTLQEMEPLFAAVAHGCRAGLHQEALDDVFWKRIRRGNEGYNVKKLGAFGADIAALSHFFEVPWDQPATGLTEKDKAVTLSMAAFGLRAVGRLQEAIQPMAAGLAKRGGNAHLPCRCPPSVRPTGRGGNIVPGGGRDAKETAA